jgi:phospholipid/cholesterol/gamma-HCH transport system substrate-binding protein
MDENVTKFRVGAFVLMGMMILGILIWVNTEAWVSQYDVYVKPERAPGVKTGTPIRKNGILIGRVKHVQTEDGYVLLHLGINNNEKIYENESCRIGTESVLGDAVIEFLPRAKDTRGALIGNSHSIETVTIAQNPMEIMTRFGDLQPQLDKTLSVMQEAGQSIKKAGDGVGSLTTSLDSLLQDDEGDFKQLVENLTSMSRKAELALDSFNKTFENLNNIVGDPQLKDEFKKSLAELPKIFQEIRVTISDTRRTVQRFGTIPDSVNGTLKKAGGTLGKVDKTLNNVNGFAATLNQQAPEIVADVRRSLKSVDKFLDDIKGFTKQFEKFKDADGTITKLLTDDEIYNSIVKTIKNVEDVSIRLEPLMDDIRLFGDAVARDPGVIGARGALDRRPSKTGYKGNAGRGGLLGIPRD